jgi:hypothetical protein
MSRLETEENGFTVLGAVFPIHSCGLFWHWVKKKLSFCTPSQFLQGKPGLIRFLVAEPVPVTPKTGANRFAIEFGPRWD